MKKATSAYCCFSTDLTLLKSNTSQNCSAEGNTSCSAEGNTRRCHKTLSFLALVSTQFCQITISTNAHMIEPYVPSGFATGIG